MNQISNTCCLICKIIYFKSKNVKYYDEYKLFDMEHTPSLSIPITTLTEFCRHSKYPASISLEKCVIEKDNFETFKCASTVTMT